MTGANFRNVSKCFAFMRHDDVLSDLLIGENAEFAVEHAHEWAEINPVLFDEQNHSLADFKFWHSCHLQGCITNRAAQELERYRLARATFEDLVGLKIHQCEYDPILAGRAPLRTRSEHFSHENQLGLVGHFVEGGWNDRRGTCLDGQQARKAANQQHCERET